MTTSIRKSNLPDNSIWRGRSMDDYYDEELVAANFLTGNGVSRAISLIYDDPELRGLPWDSPDGLTLFVPHESIDLLRRKGLEFTLSDLKDQEFIMENPPQARVESKTRVTFFLPSKMPGEKIAILALQRHLEKQHLNKDLRVTGYTRSNIRSPSLQGSWYDDGWCRDSVIMFVIDYPCESHDPSLDRQLKRLRRVVQFFYWKVKRPQRAVWIITQTARCYV
ncbi:MAG: hypothetical protein NUV53_05325 [Patescibacteria group bacterium]|nr:hypothetical protein [Patescibacteria group bacterium]